MPLVSIKQDLIRAMTEAYAVPLFDVFTMQDIDGVFDALEEKRAPTILAVYCEFIDMPTAEAVAGYVKARARRTTVPVSLMLDHGSSLEQCVKALSYGFTDVMYDGSQAALEENIAATRLIVRAAHAVGAAVEAELGHVGLGSDYDTFGSRRQGFTDPTTVPYFVEKTGVDFLAVAFGSAHGFYKGEAQLDLDLLRKIRERVAIPLVLHGGTGLSDEQFRLSIQGGVSKINISTILEVTAARKMREAARDEDASIFTIVEAERKAYHECCARLLGVFGASGKG
ncbi:MAG: class II fructose-bisphosphate aldolase [Anaerolineales bacterium]|jgi:fructose-bisphosphate aldolase class II